MPPIVGDTAKLLIALLIGTAMSCFLIQGATGAVIGPNPRAAAQASTKKYVLHLLSQVGGNPNWAGVTYQLLPCRLLHRKPWLAYACEYKLDGAPGDCDAEITAGIRRLSDGSYKASAIKWRSLKDVC